MPRKIIDIDADVEDTYLKKPQTIMSAIINALHNHDSITIRFAEGPALEELNYKEKKFLQILKEICEDNNWPLEKIHFETKNKVQDKSVWPSISITDFSLGTFVWAQQHQQASSKKIDKTFGMFIGRSSWDRLLLASHLATNHKAMTLQTYRSFLDMPASMLHLDLDRLFWLTSNAGILDKKLIHSTMNFVSELPLLLDDKHKKITQLPLGSVVAEEIMSWYNNIFVDVVCEKMITGQTFYPTEKTARPLATKTPFLIMAAPNYIKNLRRLGFKSFSQFWNEGYDYQQGLQRIQSIQSIINDLARLPINELQNMYEEMEPILEHNQKTYMELTQSKVRSVFSE
jgi:hypothetical protein